MKAGKRDVSCVGRQLELDVWPRTWGGKREGAGRKRDKHSHNVPHRAREVVKPHVPMHVVMRTCADVPRLRCAAVHRELGRVLQRQLADTKFRIVQISLQHNHVHLIVEANSTQALSKGMHAFAIRLAKAINRALGRRGRVFAYRYFVAPLPTPRQVRNALNYVLNNWRHHAEDLRGARERAAMLDPYASGTTFDGWKPECGLQPPTGPIRLPVAIATTWLLRVGWRRSGLLDARDVPGSR